MPDPFCFKGQVLFNIGFQKDNKILAKGGKACYNVTKHENVNQR